MRKAVLYLRLMRLNKPIGILLLLWPTLWGLWVASNGSPPVEILSAFVLGTVLMRSAGCVMNDFADRDFDPHVERTKNRPLATGEVTKKEALALSAALSLIAFCLVLSLNTLTVELSFAALFLAASYPFTKRFLAIPQAYLGIAFGFGIPMAFAAETGSVPAIAWILFAANLFWTVAYDTEYAMVDKEDDVKIGIRTSALTFGRYDVTAVMVCYALMLSILFFLGLHQKWGVFYFLGLFCALCLALYHYFLIRKRKRENCFKAFLHNNWVGFSVFGGILLSSF